MNQKIFLYTIPIFFLLMFIYPATASITSITVSSPANDSWLDNQTVVVNFTLISDSNSTGMSCTLWNVTNSQMMGTITNITNNTMSILSANDTAGIGMNKNLNITCIDGASQDGTIFSPHIDDEYPVVTQVSPGIDNWTNDNTPPYKFYCSDNLAKNMTTEVWVSMFGRGKNTTTLNNTNTTINGNTSEGDDVYFWDVNCTDLAGNKVNTTPSLKITIDATSPIVNILNPTNASWSNLSNITINFNFTDLAPNSTCDIYINNTLFGNNGTVLNNTNTTISFNTTTSNQNTSILKIQCRDPSLNFANSTGVYLKIQNTTSNITVTYPANNTEYNQVSGSFLLNWMIDDEFIENCTYITDVTSSTTLTDCGNGTLEFSTVGNHNFTLTGRSSTGRNITSFINFTWNKVSIGGSGGGGAGVGASAAGYVTSQIGYRPENSLIDYPISDSSLRITNVNLFLKEQSISSTATVQKLDGKPSGIIDVPGKYHQYIQMSVSIDSSKYINPNVNFKVPKTFLTSNNLKDSDITLYRYNNDKWTNQITTITGSDNDYIYYNSLLEGFSLFAISSKVATVSSGTNSLPQNIVTGTQNIAETPITIGQTVVPLYIALIALIIIIFVIWLIFKKK